jgi:hypothetical protein
LEDTTEKIRLDLTQCMFEERMLFAEGCQVLVEGEVKDGKYRVNVSLRMSNFRMQ